MRFLTIIGHFSFKKESFDGQTIKTKIVCEEIEKSFPTEKVKKIDTHGHFLSFLKAPFYSYSSVKNSKNILILLGKNGLRRYSPLLFFLNKKRKTKLFYVVIGGWLPSFIGQNKKMIKYLSAFDGIYVETISMKQSLLSMGLCNVFVAPNCKQLNIIEKKDNVHFTEPPFKLCTFSRVMKEKGIEDAINAVSAINEMFSKPVCELDIFGQVDASQRQWFEDLKLSFPNFIRYSGIIPFDKSTEVLANYFLLLFPTYYDGEGFAGTIIDAFAAGLPVVASEWKYNPELISDGKTGLLFETHNVQQLINKILWSIKNVDIIESMRLNCASKAKMFLPENALSNLLSALK